MYQAKRKILVGVDYSELGDRALQSAIALACASGNTEMHVLHVAPGSPDAPVSRQDVGRIEVDLERLMARVNEQIALYREQYGDPPIPEVSAHRRTGNAADELARLAGELDVGLIVVGTHGRTGLERVVVGSVAERVVRIAGCPVLVVRPIHHPKTLALPDDVEPPCPNCVALRAEKQDPTLWCEQHAARRRRARVYASKGAATAGARPWGFS